MAPIKDLQLTYEAPNPENVFSAGDVITGVVTFTVTRQTKIQSLQVKMKVDAHVILPRGSDETSHRIFKVKQDLVSENLKDKVFPCAVHSFHFKLRIALRNIPPYFEGHDANIVCKLEAKISCGWQQISSGTKELVLSRPPRPLIAQTNVPLAQIASKRVGNLPRKLVHLSAVLQKKVYSPGDTVSVVAKITNSSLKIMRPKFNLLQTTMRCVGGHRHGTDKILRKAVGKTIEKNTEGTITCQVEIPVDASPTFLNCEMISVNYSLKVYADICLTDVPVVTLPLFIVPRRFASQLCCGIATDAEALLHRDVPLPAFVVRSGVVPAPQNAFEYPGPDPTQHAHTSDNEWSLQVPPHSSPQSPPPSYDSLYPTPHDNRQGKKSKL